MVGSHTIKAFKQKRVGGNSTVEIMLAISIFMMYGAFIIGALAFSVTTTKIPNTQKSAIQYASEGLEISRYIRKSTIANLPNGTYGLSNSGSEWTLTGSSEVIDPTYTRTITITSPTANEKLVVSNVAWTNAGRSGSESVSGIFSNWQDIIVPSVIPWQIPAFASNLTIPATTYDVMYLKILNGTLFTTLQNGATSSLFSSFNISAYPTIVKGSDVNLGAVATDTGYRYLVGDGIQRIYYTSALNGSELKGVDVATRTLFGTANLGTGTDANGIVTNGNTLYVTRTANGSTLEFNVMQNTGTGTFTTLGTINSTDTFYDVILRDSTYAYVTTNNTASELRVMNISNSAAPSQTTSINLPTTITGRFNMIMSGNYLILYRTSGTITGSSLYIYDTSTPSTPTLVGTYSIPFLVYDADVDPTRSLLFIATSDTASEFRVIDFTTPSAPVLRGIYNNAVNGTFRSVAWDSVNDRAYIGTTDDTNEIVILEEQ